MFLCFRVCLCRRPEAECLCLCAWASACLLGLCLPAACLPVLLLLRFLLGSARARTVWVWVGGHIIYYYYYLLL